MEATGRLVVLHPLSGLAAAAGALCIVWLVRRAGAGRLALGLRSVIGLAVAVAIADPRWVVGANAARMIVVDVSASIAPAAQATAEGLGRAGDGNGGADTAMRLPFGGAGASPLGPAIDLAVRALPDGGRIVVASDGAATDGDAGVAAAAQASADGVHVDAVRLAGRARADAAVLQLLAPATWRSGDFGRVDVVVAASEALSGTVSLAVDGRVVEAHDVGIGTTPSRVAFTVAVPDGTAPMQLEAAVQAGGDREPANDRRAWAVQRAAAPRVLVVGDSAEAVGLADALAAEGIVSSVLGPGRLGGRLSALEGWDACVLVDTPADALGVDQIATLEGIVAERGQGLVLTGGRQSFLQGGWRGTGLARLSPLALEAPPHGDREAVALLLLIDRSASMAGGDAATRLTKLDLAREAAVLAAEVLQPGDMLGVMAYDTAAEWVLPLAPIGSGGDRADVEGRLRTLTAGGGTLIGSALAAGLPALAAARAPTRHAILLSDGRDAGESAEPLLAAVQTARALGVTFSTLGIGLDADPDLLGRLAQLGRGRAYGAAEAADLPRLTVEESEIVRARAERTGAFRAQLAGDEPSALVAGVDVGVLPELTGYLALRPRPGVDIALRTPTGDPLLAGWQVGLGRVAAWTSDVGAEWAAAWPGDAAARAALARAVRWAARKPAAGGLEATAVTDDATGETAVTVDAVASDGSPLDLAAASLVISDTEGTSTTQLAAVGPGRYAGAVTLARTGAWPAAVVVEHEGGRSAAALTVARGYAPELMPDAGGTARLGAVAAAGGGRVLDTDAAWEPAGEGRTWPLWPAFAVLAGLLWPVDVAVQLRGRGRRRVL